MMMTSALPSRRRLKSCQQNDPTIVCVCCEIEWVWKKVRVRVCMHEWKPICVSLMMIVSLQVTLSIFRELLRTLELLMNMSQEVRGEGGEGGEGGKGGEGGGSGELPKGGQSWRKESCQSKSLAAAYLLLFWVTLDPSAHKLCLRGLPPNQS